jgi:hypothetical protein
MVGVALRIRQAGRRRTTFSLKREPETEAGGGMKTFPLSGRSRDSLERTRAFSEGTHWGFALGS